MTTTTTTTTMRTKFGHKIMANMRSKKLTIFYAQTISEYMQNKQNTLIS
jgi:hypothetical protein